MTYSVLKVPLNPNQPTNLLGQTCYGSYPGKDYMLICCSENQFVPFFKPKLGFYTVLCNNETLEFPLSSHGAGLATLGWAKVC